MLRQTRSLQQVSSISYEGFLSSITELNEISSHFLDTNGKQLVFAVKKGSDSSFLWKATVRIACVKLDAATKNIDSYRCLNLKQYLRVFNSLKTQTAAVTSTIGEVDPKDQAATSSGTRYILSFFTSGLWQYGLWSFQTGGTKLERFFLKINTLKGNC